MTPLVHPIDTLEHPLVLPRGSPTCHHARCCLLFVLMSKNPGPPLRARGIFDRLADHGIRDYGTVKSIVSFQIPQYPLFFLEQFGHRTLAEVLRQIERWKKFLKTDFVLSASQRTEVIRKINQTQFLVCLTLMQANSERVGDWELQFEWIPTGKDESGNSVYIRPALSITARHRDTGECRCASIPHEPFDDYELGKSPIQRAFEELGLWEQLRKGSPGRYLISSRKPQGWPMYSRVIIPQLYEFLLPHYSSRAHHSEKRDAAVADRKALFPKDLFEDMLDIMRNEHPEVFSQTTVNQLKASIQRHLARKATSTKSPL